MQEADSQPTWKWNKSLTWLSSHINKLWSPFQSTNSGDHPILVEKMENKKDTGENLKKLKKMDPKMAFLQKMRSGNLDQVFEQKIKRVNKYFNEKEESNEKPCDLICPICLQFQVKPVTTMCGHNFCIKCLDQTLLFKAECPSCRHYLRGTKIIKCQSLHKLILRTIQKYCTQEIELYNESLKQSVQWVENRTVKGEQLEINQKIDARDTQFIWCKATIKQLYKKQNVVQSVLIHYEGWNPIYDEIIDLTSDRLAREGFYTSRLDIPHYKNLNGEEERMYSYVVSHQNDELNHFMLINNEEDNQVWSNIPLNLMFGQDLLGNQGENPLFLLPSIQQSSLQYEEPIHGSQSYTSSEDHSQSQQFGQQVWPMHQIPQNYQYEEENESNTSEISQQRENEEKQPSQEEVNQKKQENVDHLNNEDLLDMVNGFEISQFNFNFDNLHHYYTPRFSFQPRQLILKTSEDFKKQQKEEHKQEVQEQQCQQQKWEDEGGLIKMELQLSFDSIINNSSLWTYAKDNQTKQENNPKKISIINPEKQEESLI